MEFIERLLITRSAIEAIDYFYGGYKYFLGDVENTDYLTYAPPDQSSTTPSIARELCTLLTKMSQTWASMPTDDKVAAFQKMAGRLPRIFECSSKRLLISSETVKDANQKAISIFNMSNSEDVITLRQKNDLDNYPFSSLLSMFCSELIQMLYHEKTQKAQSSFQACKMKDKNKKETLISGQEHSFFVNPFLTSAMLSDLHLKPEKINKIYSEIGESVACSLQGTLSRLILDQICCELGDNRKDYINFLIKTLNKTENYMTLWVQKNRSSMDKNIMRPYANLPLIMDLNELSKNEKYQCLTCDNIQKIIEIWEDPLTHEIDWEGVCLEDSFLYNDIIVSLVFVRDTLHDNYLQRIRRV